MFISRDDVPRSHFLNNINLSGKSAISENKWGRSEEKIKRDGLRCWLEYENEIN